MKKKILKEFKDSASIMQQFSESHADAIAEVASLIANAFIDGRKLILFGNGGCSSNASHMASELVGRFRLERPGLPAIALNTDMATITSIADDYTFSDIFSRQIRAIASEGDIALALCASGSSSNVIKALEAAKKKKLATICFTGSNGTKVSSKVDYAFVVPSSDPPRIHETHIALGHILCQIVEDILFEAPGKK